jgi:hypothetical protein
MKFVRLTWISIFVVSFTGCVALQKNTPKSYNGEYSAEVMCYNQITGVKSDYVLNVEVLENRIEKICWIPGGYYDDSKFVSPHINKKGYCEFVSEGGVRYEIQIISSGVSLKSDDDMEDEKLNYFDEDDLYWDEYPFIE